MPHMKAMNAHRPSFQPNRKSKSFLSKNNSSGAYDGSIGSGVLSPTLSFGGGGGGGGGSTTVTPLTPGTPLPTPITPLQILLGRQNSRGLLGGGPSYHRRPPLLPPPPPQLYDTSNSRSSDNNEEIDQVYREKELFALQLFANFLNNVETTLNDITDRENAGHQVLGPAIVRMCRDLADEIEGLAKDLNREHDQAAERLEQVRSDLELNLIDECIYGGVEEKSDSEAVDATNKAAFALSSFVVNSESTSTLQSHEEFMSTLSTTHTLLLDMAAALRAITQQEAQELGEVGLEVAHIFVWSLGIVHSNMIQTTVTNDFQHSVRERREDDESPHKAAGSAKQNRVTWSNHNNKSHGFGPVVEVLGEEEKEDEHALIHPGTPTKDTIELWKTPKLSPIPSSPQELSSPTLPSNISIRHSEERVRVLWPPLLSAVSDAGKHAANGAKEHPIPAIAIGLTCGPAAIATAAIAGPPLLVADWAIQSSYDALSEHTPVIENVEKGAANALQVARLAILCSKLVVKQGISVGERQIERRGGVGKVCSDVVGGAVDMALHPVDTVGAAWDGLFWMGGAVRDAVGFVKGTVSGGELGMDIH
mmetsp:Transcript_11443/g.20559  ORF Transcript_11443/g.20559 Transcript_11443/m.20559 type:complete len:591 (+) Transcript_11443:250-2022(+)